MVGEVRICDCDGITARLTQRFSERLAEWLSFSGRRGQRRPNAAAVTEVCSNCGAQWKMGIFKDRPKHPLDHQLRHY